MIRPAALEGAFLKALALVVALGATAQAALPYLPQVGPPPLRFQTVNAPAISVVHLAANPTPKLVATNPPVALQPTNSSGATNLAAATPAPDSTPVTSPAPMPAPAPMPEPAQSLGETFTASIFPIASPDLLGITPQTLATYFRPVQYGTNSPALIGPFPLTFTPPLPPDKSSHAEYILK